MNPNENMYDITIIGGGPVGLFAAFYAGMRQAKVKIIDSLENLGGQPGHLYSEKLIYDIPAYPAITGEDLTINLTDQLKRFDTSFCLGEEALNIVRFQPEIDVPYFEIESSKGKHFSRSVIIAAGNGAFQPRKLNLENAAQFESGNLHYYVNNLDKFRDRVVAICGGGDSAVDWALTLEPIAKKVYIVHRRNKFRALEHSVSLLESSSVEILTPYLPVELQGDGQTIEKVILNESRTDNLLALDVDDFIVNYGFSTSIGKIKTWGLETERNAIKVNQQLETNIPGIYAIGDIAEYPGKVKIIASGFGEAPQAVNNALFYIDPENITPSIHSTSLFEGE